MQENELTVDLDPTVGDLGPLAWVLGELRKSLDGAVKALRRFVRDADMALSSDLASLDNSHLRIARQQLHQAQGALEMVGLGAAANVLRAMEAVAQRFVQRPEMCTQAQARKVEQASFALLEYLETLLRSRQVSAVVLFPQYRDLLEIVGEERVHPADLANLNWRWLDLHLDVPDTSPSDESETRALFDKAILKLIKGSNLAAARKLAQLCRWFSATQDNPRRRAFWVLGSAYFEAIGAGWCSNDLYVKRTSSRMLTQYMALDRGEEHQMERLAHDLLFFCSQAFPQAHGDAPALNCVAKAYNLSRAAQPIDYEVRTFGRYDPAVLVQARKRIGVAKEIWAALSGGDEHKFKAAADQFELVGESLIKLDAGNEQLAHALSGAMAVTRKSGQPPTPQLALEVATAVLFLEAAYDEVDPQDSQLTARSVRLAQRLEQVTNGANPQPLEAWMEDLYRRVSERQTMGSVVSELGVTMGQLEKSMDQYFRNPTDKSILQPVPGLLAQTRGVLSLLGLDQASAAVLHMRSSVEQMLVTGDAQDPANMTRTFEQLGSNLGALGFMVDMLSYQPNLAKKMFSFDPQTGDFTALMGRLAPPVTEPVALEQALSAPAAVEFKAPDPLPAVVPAPAPADVQSASETDAELLEIFIEEAREVLQTGLQSVGYLGSAPGDLAQQTTLRRSFHTLKGSSRMVGLDQYGEAAWALEQLLNGWIAEQKPASDDLRGVSFEGLHGLQSWLEQIAQGQVSQWNAAVFRKMADSLRLEGKRVHLERCDGQENPSTAVALAAKMPEPVSELAALSDLVPMEPPASEFAATPAQAPAAQGAQPAPDLEFADIDFQSLLEVADPAPSPVADVPETPLTEEVSETESIDIDFDLDLDDLRDDGPAPGTQPESLPVVEAEASPWDAEAQEVTQPALESIDLDLELDEPVEPVEEVKIIGDLRIGIPLYNVYLNEADEWSRRLVAELSEWALELPQRVTDTSVALAHSLAGSSATVGFTELSGIARDLEHALEHVRLQGMANNAHGELFCLAAQEIRRLLHQFAAGFVKEADPVLVQSLKQLCDAVVADFSDNGFATSLSAKVPEWVESTAEPSTELQAPADQSPVQALTPEAQAEPEAIPEPLAEPLPEPEPEPEPEQVTVQEQATVPEIEPLKAPVHSEAVASSALLTPVLSNLDGLADEIDVTDSLDVDLFPIFDEEAQSLLPGLSGALRQWAARPENTGARVEVLRNLHTLKGSARLAGAMRLGEMAHRFESAVESLGSENVQGSQIESLFHRLDKLQETFEALRNADAAKTEGAIVAPPAMADADRVAPLVALDAPTARALRPIASSVPLPVQRHASAQSVRVRPQLLDRLVNQAGEVMMTRSRLEAGLNVLGGSLGELTGNLERLRSQLRDIELQAETQMQSRMAQSKDSAVGFDPLEFDRFTRVQELTRMMAESVNDVATVQRNLQRAVESTEDSLVAQARQTRELQRDLLRTRMVEFESIAERLYGVVRQAGKDAGKQVRLDIVGGSIELDRSVLDRMTPAFEHLLRNCVGHGIEASADRVAAGKDATGAIAIQLAQEGNDVSVEFADDGAGLDFARIKSKAVASGLMSEFEPMTLERAADLIFAPGFSTAEQVTELAGRGIGMDVVRAEVSALGGRIETQSEPGRGSRFKLVLPLTTAVTQVVILRIGNLTVGVPSNLVETVKRVKLPQLEQAYAAGSFSDGAGALPFYWAGALLQISPRSNELDAKSLSVLIFRSAGQRVAVHVDEVLGNQEVVVKNLGPQLARLPGLAAMTVLASGAVVLIYNPVALATVYGEQARILGAQAPDQAATAAVPSPAEGENAGRQTGAEQAPRLPLILVVDDSITVRRVTQRLLLREGYRVSLAIDGLQALERLQEEMPAVVLTDIEMPRMDGFDLARNIRSDLRMKDMPIIMITSRIADKHREHATELGVNNYLGKPYSEEELLSLVRGYCSSSVPA